MDLAEKFWEFDRAVDDLSENCKVQSSSATETPGWLIDYHIPPGLTGQPFCPERLPQSGGGGAKAVRVYSLNTLVIGRISLKRAKLDLFSSKRFANSYKRVKKTGGVGDAGAYSDGVMQRHDVVSEYSHDNSHP